MHSPVGMDEHDQKVQTEAAKHGISLEEWADRIAVAFREAWTRLGLSNDGLLGTSEPRYHRGVTALMERIRDNGDFRRATYQGYYCAGCEAVNARMISKTNNVRCTPARNIESEEHWFFCLSEYSNSVLKRVREDLDWARPAARRHEILRLLEGGLADISASRSRVKWGTPILRTTIGGLRTSAS